EVRNALDRMWPLLSPAELLHDLFGSMALLRLAADGTLDDFEYKALHRPRVSEVHEVRWTDADAPLLDEVRALLGPRPGKAGRLDEAEEIRTYGHIVIDEVQDLTPMQLRMASRRSLNGSMTVVGDIAQATGAHAPDDWDQVLAHLPDRRPARLSELTVGYRIPAQSMALASRVLRVAAPQLRPPTSVREGADPVIARTDPSGLGALVADQVAALQQQVDDGSVAVVVPASLTETVADALDLAGVPFGRATRSGLDAPVTLVPVSLVKGLELDAVVVVEPSRIVREEPQGLRALYVALTRATKLLAVAHAEPLPEALVDQ
ncbi:MAG TPA: ATP-binding domain-containing protein, partial [Acidimicrobiales bacterium]